LENCRSEHSWCRSGGSATSQLPKRIIDVSEPRRPRLKEPDGHTGDYAALSYCWGTIPQLQTTEENYLQHTIGLDLDSLPQSITDAITVTYQLGFKYLWVDALCIIQDSKVDVAEQVSRMDQIYHDSTLTIAAAHGTSVHTGLFVNRDSRLTKPCKVNISLRTATDTLSEDFIFTHRSEEEKHLPLYTRGWVLQEEILPSRKLIFGSFMISWHCMMGYQSESYHSVNPADLSSGKDTEKLSHWIRNPKLMNSQEQKRFQGRRDNIFDSWYRVVSKYSTRRLTHDCDKLPAIAGLAASIKRVQNSTYLAGLWAEDFQRGLAWYIESGRHNCSPDDAGNFEELPLSRASSAYIAPSWSWASVKG
ncbi:heterokaryon incompatibility protein-domain-containing protein, partial [Leptodontidium sp. 2 PMI_412]